MKRIIVCTDGTWNSPDQKHQNRRIPSNVVKIARAVVPRTADGVQQVTYYDTGVGTGGMTDRVVGGATGKGLSANIVQAYRFLSHNYEPGDELFLFGFSRGAYTARSLAGMINKMGIIHKRNVFFMNECYDMYRQQDNDTGVRAFREKQDCVSADVRFVGVWDTVGALGIPTRFLGALSHKRHAFHDVSLGACIKNGYHAVAVDERRKPFKPTLWDCEPNADQTIEQRWFAGVHTNIGGGYDDGGLSNIALQWMATKARSHGLELDTDYLGFFRPYHKDTLYDSKKWYYIGSHVRPLFATGNGFEVLDDSVCHRIRDVEDYAPENVDSTLCRE